VREMIENSCTQREAQRVELSLRDI
jgi:hypothetical protein